MTNTKDTTEACREAYNAWAEDKREDLYGLEWQAWQAAWNTRQQDAVNEEAVKAEIHGAIYRTHNGDLRNIEEVTDSVFDYIRPYLRTAQPAADLGKVREALEFSRRELLTCGGYINAAVIAAIDNALTQLTDITTSPYADYTWEDVAMLVQENRAIKAAILTQAQEAGDE